MARNVASRIALLLLCSVISCGCGIRAGYFASDPALTWPDSYYYAAVRADARQWQAVNDSGASVASATASQSAILADLPFSVIADTAVLPVLLWPSVARTLSERTHSAPVGEGGETQPAGDETAQSPAR